ncbi:MAG: hypothetical protein F6J86_38505 [Symploca sp. SIO1B1]|nr:hypothetical protein [Symploca sp. SIO1B1]
MLEFTSTQNYDIATIDNPWRIDKDLPIYVASWSNNSEKAEEPIFTLVKGSIVSKSQESKDGDDLAYNLEFIKPGIRGGPVINNEGHLIGINRQGKADSTKSLALGIPIDKLRTSVSTVIKSTGVNFFCGKLNEVYTTFASGPIGLLPVIQWTSQKNSLSNKERCIQVSRRFQTLQQKGMLNYITHGQLNGQSVLCATSYNGGECTDLLLIVPPGTDPKVVLEQLLGVQNIASSPLSL